MPRQRVNPHARPAPLPAGGARSSLAGMDVNDAATWVVALVAAAALGVSFIRDRRSDVAKTLERIEGDVKDLGNEMRKLGDRVGAVETRLAVVEDRLLIRPAGPDAPKAAAPS